MRPELFEIPIIHKGVPAYGTMLMTGFLLAVLLTRRRAGALGLDKGQVFDLGFVAVISGIVGARLLHVVLNLGFYFAWPESQGFFGWLGASLFRVIATWNGGLVYYGGLGGGILGLALYARRKKIPVVDMLDFVGPGAALGLAMTRIGCFLNGCCFGKPTEMPWGVSFPQGSHVYQHQCAAGLIQRGDAIRPVHPTQLYEMIAALAIFAGLWFLYPRRKFAGQMAWAFGLSYCAWRFVNEFFRADSGPWRPEIGGEVRDLGPLTVFQYMSILLFAAFAVMLVLSLRRGREPFRPPAAEETGKAGPKDPAGGAAS
jgi:phosphatidylglycerol:prolipoprotein diacylglycerol transferase